MRESDQLDKLIHEHFNECRQCQAEIEAQKQRPNQFGKTAKFCSIYYQLIGTYTPPEQAKEMYLVIVDYIDGEHESTYVDSVQRTEHEIVGSLKDVSGENVYVWPLENIKRVSWQPQKVPALTAVKSHDI